MKKCTKCGKGKPLSEYYERSKSGQLYAHCKSCHVEYGREREKGRVRGPEYLESRRRAYHEAADLRQAQQVAGRYKISLEEAMRIRSFPCSMCDRPDSGIAGKAMHVDHCHVTGVVRGPLCHRCNQYVGWREKDEHLEEAYERHTGRTFAARKT